MKIERTDQTGTIDRRVARTRALLQDALIALIPERGYAAITVEELCRKANVGRSTFYAHYTGKDELRSATIDAHLQSLGRRSGAVDPEADDRLFAFSLPMFRHAHAFRALHRALLSSSGDTIHDELRDRVRRVIRKELVEKRIGTNGMPVDFAVQFIAGGFLSVLAWWTAAETNLSPEQADALFQRMVVNGFGG